MVLCQVKWTDCPILTVQAHNTQSQKAICLVMAYAVTLTYLQTAPGIEYKYACSPSAQ